jgi:hypothetical protein
MLSWPARGVWIPASAGTTEVRAQRVGMALRVCSRSMGPRLRGDDSVRLCHPFQQLKRCRN